MPKIKSNHDGKLELFGVTLIPFGSAEFTDDQISRLNDVEKQWIKSGVLEIEGGKKAGKSKDDEAAAAAPVVNKGLPGLPGA